MFAKCYPNKDIHQLEKLYTVYVENKPVTFCSWCIADFAAEIPMECDKQYSFPAVLEPECKQPEKLDEIKE